jgi:hypothetical protein
MSGAKSKLRCLVWPDDMPYEHIVLVKIDDDDTVADLKKLIKVEHAPMLDKVPARDLVLWKCSGLPDGDNLERTLKTIQFDDSDVRSDVRLVRLNKALQTISQLFGDEDLSKEPIHILVEVPALGECGTRFSNSVIPSTFTLHHNNVLSHPKILCLPPPEPPPSVTTMELVPMKRGVKDIKRVSGRCVSTVFRSHSTH